MKWTFGAIHGWREIGGWLVRWIGDSTGCDGVRNAKRFGGIQRESNLDVASSQNSVQSLALAGSDGSGTVWCV